MNIPFEIQNGQALGVTRHVLNQLLALQDGSVALLFCYLLAHPEPLDFEQAEFTLGLKERELKSAFLRMRDTGLVAPLPAPAEVAPPPAPAPAPVIEVPQPIPEPAEKSPERPSYDSRRISAALKDDGAFRAVADDTENRLGRPLSPRDLQILYSIYEWRGLPAGVMSLLVTYCVEKYGPGKPPSANQIDKEASAWQSEGIDTETLAEEYLAELAAKKSLRGEILSLLQIRGRTPSMTEERYIKDWVRREYSIDLITLAYDKTVIRTGGMSWKYMDTILKSWRDKGLTTTEEVDERDVKPTRASAQPKSAKIYTPAAPDGEGEHEKAAQADMLDFLRSLKQENNNG
ncbi:hypothetical protein FACS1894208_11340 [Clostridia bacterium]|nr:hypothetical protein FACS1894208_11340 [Clostridia bacterium]